MVDSTLAVAMQAYVAVMAGLAWFASAGRHSQRERALERSERILDRINDAVRQNRTVGDDEIRESAGAYKEALRLDPVAYWTIWVTAGLTVEQIILVLVAVTTTSDWTIQLLPWNWAAGFWAVLSMVTMSAAIAAFGILDLRWVQNDLATRMKNSVMGQVQEALEAERGHHYSDAVAITSNLISRLPN